MKSVQFGQMAAVLAATLLVLGTVESAHAESGVRLSVGYDYSSGDYGQDVTTEIENVPVAVEYINGAWSAKLTVPYVRVTGNGTVVPGSGGMIVFRDYDSGAFGGGMSPGSGGGGSSMTETVTSSGLGDLLAALGYGFSAGGFFLDFKAKTKVATADEQLGLGTGEHDYFLEFNALLPEAEVTPFFTAGYVVTGDTESVEYEDVFYGTAGLMFRAGPDQRFGATYDYRQAALAGGEDFGLAGLFWNARHSAAWSSLLTVSAGVSDVSPDYGLSLTVTRSF